MWSRSVNHPTIKMFKPQHPHTYVTHQHASQIAQCYLRIRGENLVHLVQVHQPVISEFEFHLCWVIGLWSMGTLTVIAVQIHNFCWEMLKLACKFNHVSCSNTHTPTHSLSLSTVRISYLQLHSFSKAFQPSKQPNMSNHKNMRVKIASPMLIILSSASLTHCASLSMTGSTLSVFLSMGQCWKHVRWF